MSYRPKPTKLKILQGNPGKRPLNKLEPEPRRGIPTMPKWLKAFPVAKKEWKRESKELDEMGIMTTAECGDLAVRVYLACQIQELANEINDEGTVITITLLNKDGEEITTSTKTNPKCIQLKNLITEYRQIGSLLGLDPSSRSKLKTEKLKKPDAGDEFLSQIRK